MPIFTREMIEAAIHGFEAQKQHIDSQISELRAMLTPATKAARSDSQPAGRKRAMSAAGRKAIAEAQRKRWTDIKGESAAPAKKQRKLSTAGRAAIVAALKKRWAAKAANSGETNPVANKARKKAA
jgi:hypothetical protein